MKYLKSYIKFNESEINDIDWKEVHYLISDNTEEAKNKNWNACTTANDLTEADSYLTIDDFTQLENHDIVYNWDGIPIFDNEEYLNYNVFLEKIKKIWNTTYVYPRDFSEVPYMRGNETDGG